MTIEPQIDVDIINEILASEHRKIDNPFKLNRLLKAINALKNDDYVQGIAAEASYYVYINQPNKGYQLVKNAIAKYGNNFILSQSLFMTANELGDWQLTKNALEQLLTMDMSNSDKQNILDIYINQSLMNLDTSGEFNNILDSSFSDEDKQLIKTNITNHAAKLKENDVSIDNFKKVLNIGIAQINKLYSLNFNVELRDREGLQLVFSNESWSIEDTIEMTEIINNAILAVDDDDFQVEADEIEVFCINFPISHLPEDFSVYDNNDGEDLAQLVKSRMQSTPKPALEVLDV